MAYELYMDGFDTYSTSNIGKRWTNSSAVAISATGGRRGGGTVYNTGSGYIVRPITSSTKVTTGFAFKLSGGNFNYGSSASIAKFYADNSDQISLLATNNVASNSTFYTLHIKTGGTVLAYSNTKLYYGSWVFIELAANISNTGSYELRINGIPDIMGTADTTYHPQQYVNQFSFGTHSGFDSSIYNATWYADDFYLVYGNEFKFFGDCQIIGQSLTGDSAQGSWVGSDSNSTDNYLMVNTPDANYIKTSTIGDVALFETQDVSTVPDKTVHAVQLLTMANKTENTGRQLSMIVQNNGNISQGSAINLTNTPTLYNRVMEVNPVTGLPWTSQDINDGQVGVKVVA